MIVGLLDLLLATPNIDEDTERRAEWLRMRLTDFAPQLRRPDKGFYEVMAELQRGVAA